SRGLPANVALRNINNYLQAPQQLLPQSGIEGSNSSFLWNGTENPVDQRLWRTVTFGDGIFRLEALNDAQSVLQASFQFFRDGTFYAAKITVSTLSVSGNIQAGSVTSSGPVTGSSLTATTGTEREARTAAAGDIVASGKLQGATAAIAGNLTAGSVNTNTLTATGLGSTPLNADQLVTRTVPDARIAANIVCSPLPA